MVKTLGGQHDFSYGEIDPDFKRADDHPARKAGLRQMVNARLRNSGIVQNRSGRTALFQNSNNCLRIEEFTISSGNIFRIGFRAGRIEIRDLAGAVVGAFAAQAGGAAFPWTTFNTALIVYAVAPNAPNMTLCFPGMRPQVITWDGASTWTIAAYTETLLNNQKRTPFYRLSPQGVTIQPTARTGVATVVASDPIFVSAMVGARIRYIGRQMLVTGFNNAGSLQVSIQEPLPGNQVLTFPTDPSVPYVVGDVVIGSVTGSKGVVTQFPSGLTMTVQLLSVQTTAAPAESAIGQFARGLGTQGTGDSTLAFTTADTVVGPGGSLVCTAASAIGTPQAVAIWDEEVMNDFRGYPGSCFVDQFRLGFTNFPAIPGAIAWSSINAPTDLYPGAQPSDAIFEIAPGKVQVYYVVPGPESSEFVFCDRGVFYIKIDVTNPLKPGSVAFQRLTHDGAAQVQPRLTEELILYVNAGGSTIKAIVASGAYYRPFNTKNLNDMHSHLFDSIRCIAVPTADGDFSERYIYVLSGNGTFAVGKYNLDDIIGNGNGPVKVGWGRWTGAGVISWVAAWNADVIFSSTYFNTAVCEILDDSQYVDFALPVNNLPAAFTPSPGQGPLALFANQSVTLIDQGTRVLGTYQVNADGNIVPQNNGGENLLAPTLVAGQFWTMTVEPFCPSAPPGTDVGQRLEQRQISKFAAWVQNSTGFLMAGLFAGKQVKTSPALGTPMSQRRVPMWNVDEDATLPPVQRETVEPYRPPGTTFDSRVAIIKDTPGPLQILELVIECSV